MNVGAWTGTSYSCTNTAENRCGKAWTWELGLEQATLVLIQPKIVVVKRERGSLDLSQTSFNQLFTDITAFFVQNFVMDKNYV